MLGKLGGIQVIGGGRRESDAALRRLLLKPRVAFASFYQRPPDLACRLIQHTRGGLMLPGGFLGGWAFRNSTLNLVETERQAAQLRLSLGRSAPRLAVFAQQLAEHLFEPPSVPQRAQSRELLGIGLHERHLVYAGRWISNKGLVQMIRALNIWPLAQASLTLVGDFEDDFQISQCDGNHLNFRDFLQREALARSPRLSVRTRPPMVQSELAGLLHGADAFVCASFHEDEASGNAAHEAVLAGLPAVVTDWCGLGQLGRNTRGGTIPTFATLGGVRFSLAGLRSAIDAATRRSGDPSADPAGIDADWVRRTFSRARMEEGLRLSMDELWEQPPEPPPPGGWRSPDRARLLAELGHPGIRRAVLLASRPLPSALHVDGLGCVGDSSVSLPRLLFAIRSMYTTYPVPPTIARGATLRGFWRCRLWASERSLTEFGFPGPRMLRLGRDDWSLMKACVFERPDGDLEFRPQTADEAKCLQPAVDFGYLVPDDVAPEMFRRDWDGMDFHGNGAPGLG